MPLRFSRSLSAAAAIWASPRQRQAPPFAPKVPTWARDLIVKICAEHGVPLPARTNWRLNARSMSSGKHSYQIDAHCAGPDLRLTLLVSAGADPRDARHVLLHELAHFLDDDLAAKRAALAAKTKPIKRGVRRPRQDPHNEAFFRRAIPLFASHGEYSLPEAVVREVKTYPNHRYDLASAAVALGHPELIETVRQAQAAARRARRAPPVVEVPLHAVVPVRQGQTYSCGGCGRRLGKASLAQITFAERHGLGPLRHQVLRQGGA